MQSKIPLKWSLFIISIVVIIFVLMIIFLALGGQTFRPIQNIVFKEHMIRQASSGLPIRLKIPKINVDTHLEYVGLTFKGAVDAPKDPANAGWFDLSPRPGEKGNSVIDGHFGWKDGIPAVFDNLHKLQSGDKLYIEDEEGTTTTFVVREIRTYGEDEDASSVFNSTDGKVHLNLITCEGAWSKSRRSYSNRIVVFTDKEIVVSTTTKPTSVNHDII